MTEHILHRNWTLWFDTPYLHETYENFITDIKWISEIEKVYTIDSIENFWRLYNNILNPREISYKSSYYMYEHNTNPYMSDINHLNGGVLVFTFPFNDDLDIEDIWLKFLLTLIGENVKYSTCLTGVSIKKNRFNFTIELTIKVNKEKLTQHFINHFKKINNLDNIIVEFHAFTFE